MADGVEGREIDFVNVDFIFIIEGLLNAVLLRSIVADGVEEDAILDPKLDGVGLLSNPPAKLPVVSGLSYLFGSFLLIASFKLSNSSLVLPNDNEDDAKCLLNCAALDLRRGVGKEEGVDPGAGKFVVDIDERGVEGGRSPDILR